MISDYLNSLSDGWTIYLWLVAGAMIIVASIYGMRWGAKNEQFDEDIKYLIFKDSDRSKMKPEEFAKSQQVLAKQEARRAEILAEQAKTAARSR